MTTNEPSSRNSLASLQPRHATFVGIDSDGCVFDSMEIKQKECFHPVIISHWGLEAVEKELREAAEFVNLYSKWRGQNRFLCLVRTFNFLRSHPGVQAAGIEVPLLDSTQHMIDSGKPLSNDTLAIEAEASGDAELRSLLAWSLDVNTQIERVVKNVPPFEWARRCLDLFPLQSDTVCVSQTPTEALEREWAENGITSRVRMIAGQELGTKAEHLEMATTGKYDHDKVLMIGDAPGDREAADAVKACFYPINPGDEETSWRRLRDEAYDRFLAGTYAGEYEAALIEDFESRLPEIPPWES
ncbi:MAG: HAD family hydrolase [Verrucomicrobia bacterium]|nr:HAD family hydrolase [Verrucomicrobiota bacterium]MDA1087212.1 HAD family hydrolase [Verrucomicrobiota bacterium]